MTTTTDLYTDTIRAGGITWSPAWGYPLSGYVVSTHPEVSRIITGVLTRESWGQYLLDHWNLVAGSNRLFFGAWHNADDGAWYLDVVTVVDDRLEAEGLGRRHNQIAIWDIDNAEEIPTGGTGR